APTMQAIAKRDPRLRTYAVDLRGHGDTSMPPAGECAAIPEKCFRPADFATDIIAFMDALHIPKATLVGHSMGSFIAQELALEYPDRIDAIVLVGTAASGTGNPVMQDFLLDATIQASWKAALVQQDDFSWPKDAY